VKTKDKITDRVKDAADKAPTDKLPTDELTGVTGKARLAGDLQNLAGATAGLALSSVTDKLGALADRLEEYGENGGPGLLTAVTGVQKGDLAKGAVKGAIGSGLAAVKDKAGDALSAVKDKVMSRTGGGSGGGGKLKVTNIVEMVDVGVPVRMAYDQWTRFTDFPQFTKKVEDVEQESDEKLVWRAKVFWSRREWESTIIEQVPDSRIIWRSKGAKGSVDGAVTFHEIGPDLTRIVLVLEYHPKGFMERTGNLWRAQGRRARLELKHFQRHVMTNGLLHPDEIEGWRGEIHGGEVVQDTESEEAESEQAESEQAENEEAEDTEAEETEAEGTEPEDTGEDTGEDADIDEREERAPRARRTGGTATKTAPAATRRRSQR
jgi:uncharacterized membrane protein